ncbi:MAG TPA: bifunctional hydroxymethylpyrimidine kinase/phosphomethylpyrimidine kinase [Bryobacteraceae bacterium]|jgi:hydroxymethylpyrimidine/phosphomethylpyrimidine kinase|nr:bifunctional hydroxymethylpyrimidine kinase/phosphomethylpyrimidine kinase [Bryobacteraceae bacterium]
MLRVALTIAGSDPSGGAGIQADLKTFHRFGVYGEAVVTLLTVQNTERVSRVEALPPDLVREQIQSVISDIAPAAAKTGALGTIQIIEAVAALAGEFAFPLVVDPVMISKHGAELLADEAATALREKLLPRAAMVTPNIPEAEALTGISIRTEREMQRAAELMLTRGAKAVLIKGGHLQADPVDLLHTGNRSRFFPYPRIATRHTHGTGCTYSAAITALLAKGEQLEEAVAQARGFIQRAIESAPQLGQGSGPLNHFA